MTFVLLEPGHPDYDSARKPAMERFWHVRPQAVARCASEEDVAWTLDHARRTGTHVVPRGGGHCFAGRSSTDGIVLDLSSMRSVTIVDGVVTVGAGARLAEVYDGLAAHGLTLPAGCGPTVGIAGLTLGGGLGLLGRRYGLTADRLRGARVVLADGRIVCCDADHEPDLFWALRGAGGGQFGVVTSLVFDPVPAPVVTRFVFTWPAEQAAAVFAAWQEYAPDAPDDVNINLKITGRQVIAFGVGERVRFGPWPETSLQQPMPYRELKQSLDGIGGAVPAPAVSKSEFFRRSLPPEVIGALLATVHGHRELNLTPMGGAYNRVPAQATAFAHRNERFLVEHVTSLSDMAWARQSWAIAHPHASGRVYPNFPDLDLPGPEPYHGENLVRLTQVKRHYDPGRLLHFPQSL